MKDNWNKIAEKSELNAQKCCCPLELQLLFIDKNRSSETLANRKRQLKGPSLRCDQKTAGIAR